MENAILQAPMLQVENLGKRFGDRILFWNLGFELKQGDRLAVLGPNGSGKSTLLKVLAGLLRPSSGSVKVDGPIGYSALDLALYATLTCEEHLNLIADLWGIEASYEAALKQVGLLDAAQQQAQRLSSGMRARLKLAMATLGKPPILLLDEPSASMDSEGRDVLQNICEEQTQRGILVIATNDAAERRLANLELQIA